MNRTLFIAGPTAAGKSAVAVAVALRIGGEIISADSMQVYRGLDIGTAKPPRTDQARVRHHLIDVAGLTEHFDAAQFVRLAKRAEEEIHARGNLAVFCGGTGLYFKACIEGLGDAPPADFLLRKELEALPLDELLRELEASDPIAYEHIDRQNPRRVVRAVEVIRLTGRPFSELRSDWGGTKRKITAPAPVFALRRQPGDLTSRVNARVDAMFAAGLVEETRQLLEQGLDRNETAMQALGYRQVVAHLRGELSLEDTIELVKRRTRQFARRQGTWFRHQLACEWVPVRPEQTAANIADEIVSRWQSETAETVFYTRPPQKG